MNISEITGVGGHDPCPRVFEKYRSARRNGKLNYLVNDKLLRSVYLGERNSC